MSKPRIRVEPRPGGLSILRFPATQGPDWTWLVIWGPASSLAAHDRTMCHSPDMLRDWKIATGRA